MPKARLAVFVDGCWWHGCPTHGMTPKRNREWWVAKTSKTKLRDEERRRALEDAGWTVIRIWEHDTNEFAVSAVRQALAAQEPQRQ